LTAPELFVWFFDALVLKHTLGKQSSHILTMRHRDSIFEFQASLANCRIPSNSRKTAPEENLENRDVSENDVLCHLCGNNVGKTIHILKRVRQSGM
jgi:hypothetical protein